MYHVRYVKNHIGEVWSESENLRTSYKIFVVSIFSTNYMF